LWSLFGKEEKTFKQLYIMQLLKHWFMPKLDTYYVYSFVVDMPRTIRQDTFQLPRKGGHYKFYEAYEFLSMVYKDFQWDDPVGGVFIKYDTYIINDPDFFTVSHHLHNYKRLMGPVPANLPILPQTRVFVRGSLPTTSIGQSEFISIQEFADLVNSGLN
jgi:hypothetical protein